MRPLLTIAALAALSLPPPCFSADEPSLFISTAQPPAATVLNFSDSLGHRAVSLDLRTGDVKLSAGLKPTEGAKVFWAAVKKMFPTYGSQAEVAFSPHGGADELILDTIASAKASIRIAAYRFTSKPVATALLKAHERGVDVRVVVDKSNEGRYTAATLLANHGISVRVNRHYAIMHDKFMVVDGETVETGSFNFTKSASEKNAENVIVLHDPGVAARYAREWERLWDKGEMLGFER